jgi:gamma-glutamyl:cysteine ligase YbdK (ATP-grasp superfamily)
VRLARVEERQRATDRTVDTFAPTGRQVAAMTATVNGLHEDLAEFKADRERQRREWVEMLHSVERKLEAEILACANANTELRKLLDEEAHQRSKQRLADQQVREDERKVETKDRRQFFQRLAGVSVGGLFSIAGVIVAKLMGVG